YVKSPIQHIRDVDGLIWSDRHEVRPCHLAGLVSGLAERAENLAALIQFDYPVVSSVRHPNVLIRRNHQAIGVADTRPLLDKVAVCIKNLYPLILTVANIYPSVFVDGHAMRQVEFTNACAVFSPCLDVVSVAIELYDARIAIAIRHVNVAILCESHVGRLVEQPVCLGAGVDSTQHQQNITGRIQLEHEVAAVVGRPDVVVRVNAQTVRMRKKAFANALNKISLLVVFGEHRLRSLEQKYVAL